MWPFCLGIAAMQLEKTQWQDASCFHLQSTELYTLRKPPPKTDLKNCQLPTFRVFFSFFSFWNLIQDWILDTRGLFQVCMNLQGMNQMEMVDRCDIERKWLSAKDLVQGFTSDSQMATGHEHLRYRKAVWGIDKSITISTRMRIQSPQSDSSWKLNFKLSNHRAFLCVSRYFSYQRSGN